MHYYGTSSALCINRKMADMVHVYICQVAVIGTKYADAPPTFSTYRLTWRSSTRQINLHARDFQISRSKS